MDWTYHGISGVSQIAERRPLPMIFGRLPARAHGPHVVSDDDVRAIRWRVAQKAARVGAAFDQPCGTRRRRWGGSNPTPRGRYYRRLATEYAVSIRTVTDIVRGHTHVHVVGLPLSARYWRSAKDQRLGLLYWLVWVIWLVRQKVRAVAA